MNSRPYLDYYGLNDIAPVRQDISNLHLHFQRRASLYALLHIPPNAVRGRRILEVGPGSGHNAIFTASLKPATYTLLDGNQRSIKEVRAKLSNPTYGLQNAEVINADFVDFKDDRRFDLVIAEGIVPGQRSSAEFLRKLASFVDCGGMLIVTGMSATACFAEVCRRLMRPLIAATVSSNDLLETLCQFFEPHLSTLPGRSRLTVDWVWDNIMHPWDDGFILTPAEIVRTLMGEMTFFGSSPSLVQDARWYKSIPLDRTINAVALEQLDQWSPLAIDYRLEPFGELTKNGTGLESIALDFFHATAEAWSSNDVAAVERCLPMVLSLADMVGAPLTAQAARDYVKGMRLMISGRPYDFGTFPAWFGRGMQYLSFARL